MSIIDDSCNGTWEVHTRPITCFITSSDRGRQELVYEEYPIRIVDLEVRKLRTKKIPTDKSYGINTTLRNVLGRQKRKCKRST